MRDVSPGDNVHLIVRSQGVLERGIMEILVLDQDTFLWRTQG